MQTPSQLVCDGTLEGAEKLLTAIKLKSRQHDALSHHAA